MTVLVSGAKMIPGRLPLRRSRRGAVMILAMLLLIIFLVMVAVVINWCYLGSVNRGTQHMCSIMALAAAPELLDVNLLIGGGTTDQSAARAAALNAADAYRQRNNPVIPASERLNAGDVSVQTGFVADVTQEPIVFDPAPAEHNTVYVACLRSSGGTNPVVLPMAPSGSAVRVTVSGGACATLDNLLVGFRPEANMAAPVMPLAIQTSAWGSQRTADSNGNGILEMVLRLRSAAPPDPSAQQYPPDPSAAVLFYRGQAGDTAYSQVLPQQIAAGLLPADLPPSGLLGPATAVRLLPVVATQNGDASVTGTTQLQQALAAVVGQKQVFPLYREVTGVGDDGVGTAQVEGFVACVVLGADMADNRLVVRVEPCFLIHHTAWTEPPKATDPTDPARNLYIYKLRLSR